MSKTLVVGDEAYEYPDTGDINYGEAATGWAEAMTEIASEVSNQGDIPVTETVLVGSIVGLYTEGNITGMKFDSAYVQKIKIEGYIKRTYTDATPDKVEDFVIEGNYNGSQFNFSVNYAGDDTELEFSELSGQFKFKYLNEANQDEVTVKFIAKTLIDSEYFT